MHHMIFLEALAVILAHIVPIFLSLPFVARNLKWKDTLAGGTRMILWSFAVFVLLTMSGLIIGIPVYVIGVCSLAVSIIWAIVEKRTVWRREFIWHAMAIIIPILFGVAVFSLPFFNVHDGLPTGDIQKSI